MLSGKVTPPVKEYNAVKNFHEVEDTLSGMNHSYLL